MTHRLASTCTIALIILIMLCMGSCVCVQCVCTVCGGVFILSVCMSYVYIDIVVAPSLSLSLTPFSYNVHELPLPLSLSSFSLPPSSLPPSLVWYGSRKVADSVYSVRVQPPVPICLKAGGVYIYAAVNERPSVFCFNCNNTTECRRGQSM